jgi:hypothetical protein
VDKDTNDIRIPRAPNLEILKEIVIKSSDNEILTDIQKEHGFSKKSFLDEYVKFLKILGWIHPTKGNLLFSEKGKEIKQNLELRPDFSQEDIEIIRAEILKLPRIKNFLHGILNFENEKINERNKCYLLEDIYVKYNAYRKISKSACNREARLIVNWLLQLNMLESLPSFNSNFSEMKLCYHMIGNQMSYQDFQKIISNKEFFQKIQNEYQKRSNWIEIPILRKCICVQFNLSRKQFDDNLKLFIKTHPNFFNLSKSTIIRTEVVSEGLKYGTDIYFYIRINAELK